MSRPQKLTLDFFLHDAHASGDRKIKRLERRFGNDGYATYFKLLEKFCQEKGMRLSLADTEDAEIIAEEFNLRDCQHLFGIIQFCADIGLLNKQLWESERLVFSDAFQQRYLARLEERKTDAARKRQSRSVKALQQKIDSIPSPTPSSLSGVTTELSGVTTQLSQECHTGRPPTEEQNTEYRTQNSELRTQNSEPKKQIKSEEETKPLSYFERFKDAYNAHKPEKFGSIRLMGEDRKRVAKKLAKECGGEAIAITTMISALRVASMDPWYQGKSLSFENFASNNKIVQLSERLGEETDMGQQVALEAIGAELSRLSLTGLLPPHWASRFAKETVSELDAKQAQQYLAWLKTQEVSHAA